MSEDKESTTQATTTSSSETDTSKPSKFKTQDEAEKYLWDKLPEYANDQSSYAHWTFWGNGWWNDSLYHKDDPMLKDALKKIHDE
ncbi:uncharacterized protein I206_103621 [Kwoniella pini CBS 10737]|uniref:Uncharacterized protein n=1 Tax=Kwoniella pini CBS 10737 TaxID=1296096 RepID=A0A1B9I9N9_9TREE|nr:uncharacterized protein I206_01376 [Kwoniella pini CBS 10737]OCF52091.1 hypothetical protein I206_01376 [Kwoniella pini CBS 10737]